MSILPSHGALALLGGEPVVQRPRDDLMTWPPFGIEDQEAVLGVLLKPNFFDEVQVGAFEREFAEWVGTRYAVTMANGTMALQAAMWAAGLRRGDEIIGPSRTYWAAVLPAYSLRATIVFSDIEGKSLCVDPEDIERRITLRTKLIVVVHQYGHPADMDRINSLARRRGIKVVEDASHAHGTLYKQRIAGTLGDVAVFSCCGKTLSIGEGGVITTNDKSIYEHVLAFAHNFRFNASNVSDEALLAFAHLPMGTVTARMHNLSAALGRVQLRHLQQRLQEVDKAMNYLCDLLEGTPGIEVHRPERDSGSTMGGWYLPHAKYHAEELGGLSVSRFAEAVRAEGWWTRTRTCVSDNLHLHPLLNSADVYGDGKPTRIAHADRDVRQAAGSLPVSENLRIFTIPRFSKFAPEVIEQYSQIFRKVSAHYAQLLPGDQGDLVVIPDDRGDG